MPLFLFPLYVSLIQSLSQRASTFFSLCFVNFLVVHLLHWAEPSLNSCCNNNRNRNDIKIARNNLKAARDIMDKDGILWFTYLDCSVQCLRCERKIQCYQNNPRPLLKADTWFLFLFLHSPSVIILSHKRQIKFPKRESKQLELNEWYRVFKINFYLIISFSSR